MTVCRYFLQGNCRFGDRCRFEHAENKSDSYGARSNVNNQERYGRQYGQSYTQQYNPNLHGYYDRNGILRSSSPHGYSENYRYGSPGYSENYRYGSPGYSPGSYRNETYEYNNYYGSRHRNNSQDRYSENYRNDSQTYRQNYGEYPQYNQQTYREYPQYNQQTYGRSPQYQSSNNYQVDNTYGQNKFKWLAGDHKKQNKPKTHSNIDHGNESYSTSTPKGKVPFSFKVPESEIKKKSSSNYEVDESDQLRAELVKEDAKAWELGGLWPFTCYGPLPEKCSFPEFYDISPEELRYAAYKAEETNAYESYVQSVQNAVAQINQLRSQLQITTPQLITTLRRVWNGENLYAASRMPVSIPFLKCEESGIDVMDTPTTAIDTGSAAAAFSFKMGTETDSSTKPTTAAAFSFKLPAASEIKSTTAASNGDPKIYTPLEDLTDEEKEQFSASTFILGKIPTKPPPRLLCT